MPSFGETALGFPSRVFRYGNCSYELLSLFRHGISEVNATPRDEFENRRTGEIFIRLEIFETVEDEFHDCYSSNGN